ncbi:hypothetical protein XBJ1_2547 [Xenorhabdus bovienii SS-2004]|uniref:Uncharacterized protein n=1 Tax=Xenorhabdus bovienii (strain SS-2004) TaxID=406818 RepID=D3V1X7_XENBS|nr:hypothetical protein XBJ1_2547 [Xenorhabdus bovienii SS-2004]
MRYQPPSRLPERKVGDCGTVGKEATITIQLEVNPINCLILEDFFNGMVATKAARMRSIVIPAFHHFDDPRWSLADIKLNSLEELTIENIT